MKELERLRKEQGKVREEIRQLENRQKILLNRKSDMERKARTRRLIEHGRYWKVYSPPLPVSPVRK